MAKIIRLAMFYALLLRSGKSEHGYGIMELILKKFRRKVGPDRIGHFLEQLGRKGFVGVVAEGVEDRKSQGITKTKTGRALLVQVISRCGAIV